MVLDQPMHLVEECRDLLDLVNNDRTRASGRVEIKHLFGEIPGSSGELHKESGVEEIEAGRIWKLLLDKRGLSGLAGSPEESGLPRRKLELE